MIFGGSFDPIHNGHIQIANAAAEACSDKVMMLLSARPGHRNEPYASIEDRWQMLQLACSDQPLLHPSDLEVVRLGRSFAIDTVVDIGATSSRPVVWVIGADAVSLASTWNRYEQLRTVCSFLALHRPESRGHTVPLGFELVNSVELLQESSGRICWLSNPLSSVSATQVRKSVAAGENVENLVPPAVGSYIQSSGLYRTI